jgi:hypothetical protein
MQLTVFGPSKEVIFSFPAPNSINVQVRGPPHSWHWLFFPSDLANPAIVVANSRLLRQVRVRC